MALPRPSSYARSCACASAIPILRRSRFFAGALDESTGVKDVTWINPNGEEMTSEAWNDATMRCFGMLMDGRTQETGIKRRARDATLLLVLNGATNMVQFPLPPCYEANGWTLHLDTNDATLPDQCFDIGAVYEVTAHSLLLFERKAP